MGKRKFRIGQLFFLLLSACGMQGQDFDKMVENLLDGSVKLIYPDSLYKLTLEQKSIIILDAREREEFDVSHIEGAIYVGYKDFDMSELNVSKDVDVVVYCSVGYRSEKIGEKLQDAGFKNVNNLYGGIFGWQNKGFPLIDNTSQETQAIHAYSKSWGRWIVNGEKVYE